MSPALLSAPDSTVLITGATGLIGSNLTRELSKQGHNVRVLVRNGSNHPFLESLPIERHCGDLTNSASLLEATKNVSLVFHCAALISYKRKDRQALEAINVIGTRNLLDACLKNGVRRVVHVSSVAAIGPREAYGRSKQRAELVCDEYCTQGLDIVIAQPATVYGPGDISGNSLYPFRQVAHTHWTIISPGGKSYVALSDVLTGLALLANRGTCGGRYIFASENLTFYDVYQLIAKVQRKTVHLHVLPPLFRPLTCLLLSLAGYGPGFADHLFEKQYCNAALTRQQLDWHPKETILSAIKKMIDFYQKTGLLSETDVLECPQ